MKTILVGLVLGITALGVIAYCQALIPPTVATSSAIGGSLLVVGTPVTTTLTVSGAVTSMGCLASPTAGNSLIAGTWVDCYVSAANTVTLRMTGVVAITPASQTYMVRLYQ